MAVAAHPGTRYELGFSSLSDEVEIESVEVRGEVPSWLAGSLLRTGPARFEVGRTTLRHWFDGQAMLHRFSFGPDGVSYGNRMLRSRALEAAEEAGEIRYSEFATDPCRSIFQRVASFFKPQLADNGNVNVARLGEEFIAMTETPLPVAFDGRTLEAAGIAYDPPGVLTTAHPHHDPATSELVNFAVKLGPRNEYRFFAQRGRDEQRLLARLKTSKPSYVHSFGYTERHLVLVESPFRVNPLKLALGARPYIENYEWEGGETLLRVFDRATGELRSTHRADPFFAFHHVNAFEDGDEVVVDLLAYEDASIIDSLYLDRLRSGGSVPLPELRRLRLRPGAAEARSERLAETLFELPRIDYALNGRPYRFVYGAGARRAGDWFDQLVKVDLETGEAGTWREEGLFPGEPVFVSDRSDPAEDAGVLLSVVLDAEQARSHLVVLDARDLSELARASVPHHIPFSFHGQFDRA